MNNSDTEILDDSPSGYMSDIDGEMDSAVRIPVQNAFRDISEFYVSRSGHTRLLTATRFGKRYTLRQALYAEMPEARLCLHARLPSGPCQGV